MDIETILYKIWHELSVRHGCSAADREISPLAWYIGTGRASASFIRLVQSEKPFKIARDLHKGGSYEETIDRICKRINYERR